MFTAATWLEASNARQVNAGLEVVRLTLAHSESAINRRALRSAHESAFDR